jgi:DNA polymerase III delta prime subunit
MSAVLVIFSGLPGTGKSTLAEHVAHWLHAPVFSKDELEAALWRSGVDRAANSGWAGYELLTTLARAQLQRPVCHSRQCRDGGTHSGGLALARRRDGVALRIVETVCSDELTHRARLGDPSTRDCRVARAKPGGGDGGRRSIRVLVRRAPDTRFDSAAGPEPACAACLHLGRAGNACNYRGRLADPNALSPSTRSYRWMSRP